MIYFAQAEQLSATKIGFAKSPYHRLHNLQIGSPVELTLVRILEGTMADEKRIHALLAPHRTRGEWFALTPDLLRSDFGLPDVPLWEKPGRYVVVDGPVPDFHHLVEDAICRHQIAPSIFGLRALGDPSLINDLRNGREPKSATRKRVQEFIAILDRAA